MFLLGRLSKTMVHKVAGELESDCSPNFQVTTEGTPKSHQGSKHLPLVGASEVSLTCFTNFRK